MAVLSGSAPPGVGPGVPRGGAGVGGALRVAGVGAGEAYSPPSANPQAASVASVETSTSYPPTTHSSGSGITAQPSSSSSSPSPTVTPHTPHQPPAAHPSHQGAAPGPTTLWDFLIRGLSHAILIAMETIQHVFGYLFTPHVVFSHVVAAWLLFTLREQGVLNHELVRAAIVEEVVSYLLWLLIPNAGASILTIYFCIFVYETVIGPKVVVRNNARLLADDSIAEALRESQPSLKFGTEKSDNLCFIHTHLKYVELNKSLWSQPNQTDIVIPLHDISRLEAGFDAELARTMRKDGVRAAQCLQLHLGTNVIITLIAPSSEDCNLWLGALQSLYDSQSEEDLRAKWLRKALQAAGVGGTEGVGLDQALTVLDKCCRPMDRTYAQELFKSVNKSAGMKHSDAALSADSLSRFFGRVTTRPDVQGVFDGLVNKTPGESLMSMVQFHQFLRDEQKEDVTFTHAKSWIRESETVTASLNISIVGFLNYLLSGGGSVYGGCGHVYQDMTQPLSHYYIATSHNTYLTKDQLKGRSSVDAYVSALRRGCKCVELDCWDGPNNEPIIYHGFTLTSKILFRDVIKAIRDWAFVVSDYPVILSFENHCSVEQQRIMASHLVNILGDKLYTKAIPEFNKNLPSPEELKGYVLVKGKKLKEVDVDCEFDDEFSDDESLAEDFHIVPASPTEKTEDSLSVSSLETDDVISDSFGGDCPGEDVSGNGADGSKTDKKTLRKLFTKFRKDKREQDPTVKNKVPKIAQELSDLVVYCQSVHFNGFEFAKENSKYYEMSSFGEKKGVKLTKEEGSAWIRYNTRQLSRIYPAGSRFDSSNYDPHPFWNAGCQMVAMNYQTADRPMQINQGMFHDNGGCGYVLKPHHLRKDIHELLDGTNKKTVDIRVISAHQLPYHTEKQVKNERTLSVTIRTSGAVGDYHKQKTRVVKDNGFNPVWNETLTLHVTKADLAVVSLFVVEKSDCVVAQFSLPLRCMAQGYRRVPLWSKASEPLKHSYLLVHVTIADTELDDPEDHEEEEKKSR